jgi:flagellar basal-body rod protein FlgB
MGLELEHEMRIFETVFGNYSEDIGRALDKTSQRQALLTRNISNVNTPNYKREDMDFNIVLTDQESKFGRDSGGKSGWNTIRDDSASANTSIRLDGNNVDMEREVFAMAESELRYQMLTDMASRYFSGLKSVIREGR